MSVSDGARRKQEGGGMPELRHNSRGEGSLSDRRVLPMGRQSCGALWACQQFSLAGCGVTATCDFPGLL